MKPQEAWRRITNLSLVGSVVRDRLLDLHDSYSRDPFAQLYRVVRPYTICGNARLRALYRAVRRVVTQRIPGDLVECGTGRGGSAALMGLTIKQLSESRAVWVFDTFEGLPAPTHDDPDWEIAQLYTGAFKGSLRDVTEWFERLNILSQARLIPGRFQDTLPRANLSAIAVLHIDGDWYDSVKTCLEQLYDRVSPKGVIQIDDYGHWAGARKAVDEFLRQRSITEPLRILDYTGRQLLKR